MTEEGDDLKSRLSKWLEEQGYPLEMVVARAFRRAGFRTIQSEYYDDPETGKSREIDVSASIQRQVHDFLVRIDFCIECKLARDRPWVMFTSSDVLLADPARVVQRATSTLGRALLESICRRKDIQNLPNFLVPERPGYGLVQSFTSGHDVPYVAVMTATKATVAIAKEADKASQFQGPVCEIVFPVVAIDGKLFECYLDDAGRIITGEMQIGILVWRSPVVGMPHTIIQVVTLPAIDDFVKAARETSIALLETCEGELAELSKKIPENAPRWIKPNH